MTDPAQPNQGYTPDTARDVGQTPTGGAAKKKRTFTVGQVVAAILLVLVIVFVVENTADVKIRIIAGPKVTTPVWVALLAAAVLGGLITLLLSWRRHRKHS